jgi:hypothetical protein
VLFDEDEDASGVVVAPEPGVLEGVAAPDPAALWQVVHVASVRPAWSAGRAGPTPFAWQATQVVRPAWSAGSCVANVAPLDGALAVADAALGVAPADEPRVGALVGWPPEDAN